MDDPTPYRRSNLREALIARAVMVLEERGSAALSLRELARDVGVSHAAPARHFADRTQLLEALAIEGFRQLRTQLDDATATSKTAADQARHLAQTYLEFAIRKANLVEVMFRHEPGVERDAVGVSAAAAFEPLLTLFRRAKTSDSIRDDVDATTAATLFLATLQGTASLINCGVVDAGSAHALANEAVARFIDEPTTK